MRVHSDANIMNTNQPTEISGNIVSKLSLRAKVEKTMEDKVDLSKAGRLRGINSTAPVRKVKTAGLIITDLKITRPNGEDSPRSFEIYTATVSNERHALGTSENRLGGNTRSIDNPPEDLKLARSIIKDLPMAKEAVDKVGKDMEDKPLQAILAQGNLNNDLVLDLLR